ncbi:hypothetical protein EBZ70_10395 [bacterium]|nr:hypothetical protein [bacterium]
MDLNPPPIPFYGTLWDVLPDTSALKRWTAELAAAAACTSHTADPWTAVGQGMLIEHHDVDEVDALMPTIAQSAGMHLVVMEVDGVESPFDALGEEEPVLVFLRPGEWLGGDLGDAPVLFGRARNPHFDPRAAYAFRHTLGSALLGAWSGRPMVMVTAVESHDQMDPLLRARGLFDRKLALPRFTPEVHAGMFLAEVGRHRFAREVLEGQVRLGALLANQYACSRRRGLLATALARACERSGKPIAFRDILECMTYGTTEGDDAPLLQDEDYWAIAVHEAGHALIAHLDSRDKVIPAYCTVLPRGDTLGLMTQPADAHFHTNPNSRVRDMRHSIRVDLAGRAAEVLLLGPEEVSVRGARRDLQSATEDAMAMFGAWGIPTDLAREAAGSNLAAFGRRPSESDRERVESLARAYLEREFATVTAMLEAHRETLVAIATELAEKKVLVASEMTFLLRAA